jgi:hypothetical protein
MRELDPFGGHSTDRSPQTQTHRAEPRSRFSRLVFSTMRRSSTNAPQRAGAIAMAVGHERYTALRISATVRNLAVESEQERPDFRHHRSFRVPFS